MYKNQLQELAQRSCFNLPSYTCLREGPDHAPRFKSTVNFNGETFHSPQFYSTLRQAEHAAAEVALNSLSTRAPSHSLAARILDETGVYKNLLQEIAQRVGSPLPQYTTFRSGLGHQPVFTGMVELADIIFTGEHAKNKKQAEKNAAMAAWTSLKQLAQQDSSSSSETDNSDELEQIKIARALLNYRFKIRMGMSNSSQLSFERKFQFQNPRPSTSPHPRQATGSKILPLICPKTTYRARATSRATSPSPVDGPSQLQPSPLISPQKFPAPGASPYIPIRHCRSPCPGIAPAVSVRSVVPVFAAPPLPPPHLHLSQSVPSQPVRIAPPVTIRQAVPVFASPPVQKEESKPDEALALRHQSSAKPDETKPVFATLPVQKEDPKPVEALALPHQSSAKPHETKPVFATPPLLKEESKPVETLASPHQSLAQPDETKRENSDDHSRRS